MYADRVASGVKRSIQDRLDGDIAQDYGRNRSHNLKRQRQGDGKWKHDLYADAKGPQFSKVTVGSRDLRLKLQKSAQQASSASKGNRVRDLREKLSGIMTPQPTNADPPKAKVVAVIDKHIKKSSSSTRATQTETKKVSIPPSSSKNASKKSESTVDGLLCSLGLEKYSIQFQAEEVDMAALQHMTDDDLKALGIPMGPRKKIMAALEPSG